MNHQYLIFCFVIFVLTFILTFLIKKFALKKIILDIPNNRSSHSTPIPRIGGLAIAISWFIALIYFFIQKNINLKLFYALISGVILVIVGLIDDVFSLKPGIRFLSQFLTALIGLIIIGGLKTFDLGFYVFQNKIILTFLALIGIIWSINLFNFLDGIDGYISTEIIFIFLSIFLIFQDNLSLILVFVVLGFLIWNWQPAKIFMGDVGSTLLGYNVAIFAIYFQNTNKTSLIFWLILTSVFWVDATLTLLRRWKHKEKLSEAHRKHAYQRIVQYGYSHQQTDIYQIMTNLLICFPLAFLTIRYSKFCLLFLGIDILILFVIIKIIDKRKAFE